MRGFGLAIFVTGLSLAGGAGAAERIQVPQMAGWTVVSTVADQTGEATEMIPDGETAANWSRRVTIQAFRGIRMTVPDFLEQVAVHAAPVCDGATAGPASLGKVGGMPAGTRTVACGRYKGDDRGTFSLHYVIAGRAALYVVTRVWRGAPFDPAFMPISAAELAEWTDYVNAIELCDTEDPNRPCR